MSSPITFATDSFAGSDVNPLASPWATASGASTGLQQVSNAVRSVTVNQIGTSRYSAFNLSAMRSSATIVAHGAGGQIGVGVRCSSTQYTLYALSIGGDFRLYKYVNTAFTDLTPSGVAGSVSPGDTVGILAIGSNIYLYKNGAVISGPISDSAIESGTWCVRMYDDTALANQQLDDIVMETYEPVFMGAGAKGAAASGNITLGEPTYATGFTKAVDDIWIAAVHSSDQVAHTFSGWTQIAQANGGSTTSRLSVWYHRYAGSNPNFVVTHAAGQSPIGGIVAYRPCLATGSPVHVSSAIAAGSSGSIAHTAVTPTVDETKLLVINGAADDNARTALTGYTSLLNEAANLAFITTLGTPDGSVSIFEKNKAVAQTVSSGTITVTQAATDPWAAMLLALEGAAAAATLIPVNLPADAMGSYSDAITVERRGPLRWADSVVFDLPSLGTTPKEANFPADSLGPYVDQAPVLRLALNAAPSADSMTMADQAPTIDRRGILTAALAADSLGLYADAFIAAKSREATAPADNLHQWADQASFSKPVVTTTPIDVPLPTDSLNNWADSRAGLEIYSAVPAADSLGLYADAAALRRANLVAPSADSLGFYTDYPPTVDRQIVGATDITRSLGPDSLNNWADSFTGIKTREATAAPDGLNLWADSASKFLSEITATPKNVTPPADSLGLYADQAPTIRENLFASPDADTLLIGSGEYYGGGDYGEGLYGSNLDSIAARLTYSAVAADALPSYVDQLSISRLTVKSAGLTDALPSYGDQATIRLHKSAGFSEALGSYSDTQTVASAKNVSRTDTLANWGDQLNAAAPSLTRIGWIDSVTATTLPVRLGWVDSVTVFRSLGTDRRVELTSIKPIALDSANLIVGYNHGFVIYLVDELGNYILDENGNRILTSGLIDNLVHGDSVAITRTASGITPRFATFTDAIPAPLDSLQVTRGVIPREAVFSDPLETYNDAPAQVQQVGFLIVSSIDNLGGYTDFTPAITTTGEKRISQSDAIPAQTDSVQIRYTAFLTVSSADSLENYVDGAAINTSGSLPITLSDALDPHQDSLAIYRTGALFASLSDAIGVPTDAAAITLGIQKAASDNLAAYSDSPTHGRGLFYSIPPDSLANYLDTATRGGAGLLQVALSDNLGQYNDARATFANFRAQPPADNLSLYGDSLSGLLGLNHLHSDGLFLGVRFDDALEVRAGLFNELRYEISDDLNQWTDAPIYRRGYFAIRLSGKTTERINLTGKVVEEQISINGKTADRADITGEIYVGET